MYNIKTDIFQKILKKQFDSYVGNSCETIENICKEDIDSEIKQKLIKSAIKKYAYNAMRGIDEQISAFSKGVNININFKRPTSK